MERIGIATRRPYDVLVGAGLLDRLGELLGAAGCVFVVTDETVAAYYLNKTLAALAAAGLRTESAVLPAGEATKSFEYYVNLINRFAAVPLTRGDTVLALGGGVICDLAGFAAATYLRGVRLVNVPTTLLAMVDAGVGGKTGIDLLSGKNLVGAFWQPSLVVCDTQTLATLPPQERKNGLAEVVKTAILFDPALFAALEGEEKISDATISACVRHKGVAVSDDERDNGRRQLLNLGHTIGHAVEACSGYRVPHGAAVAVGLAAMARGFCAPADRDRILALLARLGLPTQTPFSAAELASAACGDKKRRGDTITLVLPLRIGECVLRAFPVGEAEAIFGRCLA